MSHRRVRLGPPAGIVAAGLVAALVTVAPAAAQTVVLDEAASELRSRPVYVDPRAERAISDRDAVRLRDRIASRDAGPLYLAILPRSAADAAGGDPDRALELLAEQVARPGVYVAVVGSSLRAGATEGILRAGEAGLLASEALEEAGDRGTMPVLLDLIDRIGRARANGGSARGDRDGDGDGFGGGAILVLLAGGGAVFLVARGRRRRRERQELATVKDFARDDLVSLGDDIRALELDVEMPDAPAGVRDDYNRAVERYGQADAAWERAGRPEDLEEVTALLEEGRHAIASVRARLDGRQPPERRPPCFFDPRHGPSTQDVEWAPPGGAPRPVPVCADDARRMEMGEEPHVRRVDGVPYWEAGPMYTPWAAGFFGAGLLPGLFFGSMLGTGLGFFASPALGAGFEEGGDFGGGGDLGGGDFGGGDFGGGDFGGGDF